MEANFGEVLGQRKERCEKCVKIADGHVDKN
jgi:hypothetical protein